MKLSKSMLLALALALAVFGSLVFTNESAAVPATVTKAKPPVVFLILDEFPTVSLLTGKSRMFRSRFPHFHRLTKQAIWYPDHTTNAHMTYRSVPAMLSGKLPALKDQFPTEKNYPQNLFTVMNEKGYHLNGGETATQLCPPSICPLPAPSLFAESDYKGPLDFLRSKTRLNRADARQGNMKWAKNLKLRAGEYTFRHSMIPHEAYVFLPNGKKVAGHSIPRLGNKEEAGKISKEAGFVSVAYHQSLLQIGYLDRMIGFIRKRAIQQGKWKDMMLIVTSDHGSSFRRGEYRRKISDRNIGSIGFAPLFIKYPGSLNGGISRKPTQSIDILPTMAESLGLNIGPVDGVSISTLTSRPRQLNIDNKSYSLLRYKSKRRSDVIYRDELLGTGPLYRIGPSSHLIDRRSPRRRIHRRLVRLDKPSQYRRVNPNKRVVPAMIAGTTRLRVGTTLAISLNGVVRATAKVFSDGRKRKFGGLVNPDFFRKKNQVQIFRVIHGRVRARIR